VEHAGNRRTLGRPLIVERDRQRARVEPPRDEPREHGPRSPGAAAEDRLDRGALPRRRALADADGPRPAAGDRLLRAVEGDERLHAGERQITVRALVYAHGPVALAAFVRAQLLEVHVAGAHELTVAVLEQQSARVPGGRRGRRRRSHGSLAYRDR